MCISLLSSTYQDPSPLESTTTNTIPSLDNSSPTTDFSPPKSSPPTPTCAKENLSLSTSTPPEASISEDTSSSDQITVLSPTVSTSNISESFDSNDGVPPTPTLSIFSSSTTSPNESLSTSKTSDCSSVMNSSFTTTQSTPKEGLPSPIPYQDTPSSRSEVDVTPLPSTPINPTTLSSEIKPLHEVVNDDITTQQSPSPITFPNLTTSTSSSSPTTSAPENKGNSVVDNEIKEAKEFNSMEECVTEIHRLRKENEDIKQRSCIEMEMLRTQLTRAQKENEQVNLNKSQSVESCSTNNSSTGVSWVKRSETTRAECMRILENESVGIDHLVTELASINRTLSGQLTKMKNSLGLPLPAPVHQHFQS
eukprot:TRINITY_DN10900_c0_g1_i1.p1 TRINITY_DN10900_c0_g1~~TRINITY_DN10900_c0_g1_i1.p1  ORF type:complete len:429 (-),score=134.39 TRINITY_DN10900_c0_g1_i1:70-1164(-)